VLGQAHRPQQRLLGLAAAFVAVLVVPAVGGADASKNADALKRENARLAHQSRSVVLGLYSLDSQLTAAQSRLSALRAQAVRLRGERASLADQLHVARAGMAISQRRLGVHLRQIYEQGDTSAIEIILGSKSLDDALTSLDNLNRTASLDKAVLAQLRGARKRLTGAAHALEARTQALAAATRSAEATAASLRQAKTERTAYVSRLATQRQLNSAQIGSLEAQARAATVRTPELTRSAPETTVAGAPTTLVAPGAVVAPGATGGRVITVSATGYALSGTTATGLPVGWGVAAVDPSVIPLGTHMTIPGYGEAVAADTGGAIVGATIDLWFPSVAQAQAWGRRTVTITLH